MNFCFQQNIQCTPTLHQQKRYRRFLDNMLNNFLVLFRLKFKNFQPTAVDNHLTNDVLNYSPLASRDRQEADCTLAAHSQKKNCVYNIHTLVFALLAASRERVRARGCGRFTGRLALLFKVSHQPYNNLKKCLRGQVTMLFWFSAEYFEPIAAPTPLTSFIKKVFLMGNFGGCNRSLAHTN